MLGLYTEVHVHSKRACDFSSPHHRSTGPPPPAHGTTTLAFLYADGVAVATDSRASAGNLVCSPDSRKAFVIHRHLLVTTSGSSADCLFFKRALARQCRLYQLQNGYMPTVRGAAKMLSVLMMPFRGTKVCAAVTLCGWDRDGPCICYVYNDGTRLSSDIISVGSGSPYAYSIIDEGYKPGMKEEEARQLARRAVCHAGRRDAYSGGLVDVYWVKEGGCEMDPREDLAQLYERIVEETNAEKQTSAAAPSLQNPINR
ncbi:PREDICTED: proteasome subunit beta type-11-like [Nanorana parkeri]|uniref:proteasome subunit beta type-11-like n=1 Tax=Nanorana parkeri TaxID=125878 RepID=UPI00085496A1|nr:PREDICTED: proteasome subunit beta type-11-like [Nanorana parkeri]